MNNKEIDKLITALQEMKTPEPEEIVIPPCGWWFDVIGEIEVSRWPKEAVKLGNKRTTEEACKLASKRMIRTNRLSLLAHILGVEKTFNAGVNNNYYVYQAVHKDINSWGVHSSEHLYYPDRVYMTREGAKSVATILNNNEWDLEVDDESNNRR